MRTISTLFLWWVAALFCSAENPSHTGRFFTLNYPAPSFSTPNPTPGVLPYGVTYTLWIPAGTKVLRGLIVHQHGCGTGACQGGATAAYDLHWQELARKWDCALLGPSYHQEDAQDCRMWCDPRNGSEFTFLKALQDLSRMASHPELESVPWCLWGHSGGAFWASLMQTKYPERIVAIWFRSGTAFTAWEKGEIPKPSLPPSMFKIPMVVNPGAKERGDGRFDGAWTGGLAMFLAYRAQDAPIAFAPDPRTAHETGDSRYLAIPFFDACLRMRLPRGADPVQPLRPVVSRENWLAPLLSDEAVPASKYKGSQTNSVWLPNAAIAKAWSEYVRTGATSDTTPPPSPIHVEVRHRIPAEVELTWEAHADFESGLSGFIVQRDGVEIGRVPEKPVGHFGRPLFQSMSYHDTPQAPLPEMQFLDRSFKPGSRPRYEVISINSVGLKSRPSKARWKD